MKRLAVSKTAAAGVAAVYLTVAVAGTNPDVHPVPTGATVIPIATGTSATSTTSLVHYGPNMMADEQVVQFTWPSWGVEQGPPGAG